MSRVGIVLGLIVIISGFLNAAKLDASSVSPTQVVQKPSPSVALTSTPVPHGSVSSDSQGGPLLAWLTLVFIALSAVATVYIARFNRRLVDVTKDMEKATSEAAEAAKQSAQAAEASLHTDRRFLLVTTIKTKVSDLGEFENKNLYAYIVLRNFGNGPADITDYIAQADLFDPPTSGRGDPPVWYGPDDGNRINDSLVAPAEVVQDRLIATLSMSREEYDSAFTDEKRVGIHGRIRYRGASKQIYESRFFWWFFFDQGQVVARALTKELNDHT
jgi:hypothetical protein